MNTTTDRPNKVHHGKNVKRFREMFALKQEALAIELGDQWSQKRISVLESKEKIDEEILAEIAKALKIPVEAILTFDEEKTIMNIQNNYEGANQGSGALINGAYHVCTFNPLDKLLETMDELKSLYTENKNLYERLLQSERNQIEILKSK
ncbi:MAG TPA: helix-turn-helix transcriptional regulator [Pedobacter sp.]